MRRRASMMVVFLYAVISVVCMQEGAFALDIEKNEKSGTKQSIQGEMQPIEQLVESAGFTEEIRQMIVVSTPDWKSRKASFQAFEKIEGQWVPALKPMSAVVGKNGFALPQDKKEGDYKSPAGVYKLGTAFGTAVKPVGVTLPYRLVTRQDYWIDDKTSPDYNTWVHYEGNPKKRWKSFEHLAIPLYKYALVIRYNDNPVVPGKGSAIFMHIWRGPTSYTAGCVALPETNLLAVLKWLNPQKAPVIVQGPVAFLTASKK